MSNWLTRFHTAAARLDAAPSSPPEMPDAVFDALVEGRIGEIDDLDTLTPLEEEIPFADARPTLAQRPITALALAMLCRALPAATDVARLVRPGEITILSCHPAGLAPDLARLLQDLIGAEHPGSKVALTCAAPPPGPVSDPQSGSPSGSEDKPSEAVQSFWTGLLASGAMPHVLVLAEEAMLPRRMARLLPRPHRVGPPDGASLAAVLCLAGAAAANDHPASSALEADLPADAALRGLEAEAWRLALRAPDPAAWPPALQRLANAAPAGVAAFLTLDDLALDAGPARDAALRLVADLAAWRAGGVAWSEMTRSLLIHGAPGTGKTWLARAIAGSAGVPLIAGSLGEWQAAGHLGDLLRAMRSCIARARAAAPCVLFIDELDAVGSRGSDDRHAATYRAQVIAGLLEQLDGVLGLEGVLVLAATNNPEAIDPALRRPGRLDRSVALPLPGRAALRALLARRLGKALSRADLDDLARRAIGQSPAEIDGALREARSRARVAARPLTAADIAAALGLASEDPSLIRRMAIHEAGHAVALRRLRRGRITGLRIGASGGCVAVEDQAVIETRAGLEARITCWLAGRAAEMLMLGTPSTGAGGAADSDLAMATQLVIKLELAWGLGTGLTWHAAPFARLAGDPQFRDRVEAHLQRAHAEATTLLKADRPLLAALALRLEAERIIDGDPFAVADAGVIDDALLDSDVPVATTPRGYHGRVAP